jgi:Nucleotidyl transferase AbiEii toxin, Type IV TA system
MNQIYLDTARLLTQIAPFIFFDGTFALKGGTAINLFVRDIPRLSDFDHVFADHQPPRDQALQRINDALRQSADRLNKRGFLTRASMSAEAGETKLLVRRGAKEVKIEANFVIRGTVHPIRKASLDTTRPRYLAPRYSARLREQFPRYDDRARGAKIFARSARPAFGRVASRIERRRARIPSFIGCQSTKVVTARADPH